MNEHRNDIKTGRFISIGVVLAVALFLFSLRLAHLQISQHDRYSALADQTYTVNNTITAARGEILDRNSVPIAANDASFAVRLDKNFISDTNKTILSVVGILRESGIPWNTSLPLEYNGDSFSFSQNSDGEIQKMKSFLGLQSYATVENVIASIKETFDLDAYSNDDFYVLAGVRYEMQRKEFEVNNPFVLASNLPIDIVTKIQEMSYLMPGVEIWEESTRIYPQGPLAAHILGRVTPLYEDDYKKLKDQGYKMSDNIGRSGIEEFMESYLKGKDGTQSIAKDKKGSVIDVAVTQEAVAGNSVILTIDSKVQKAAEESLASVMTNIRNKDNPNASGGAAVVMDVNTGEIIAMANYPTYDMNTYLADYKALQSDTALKPLINRSTMGLYAPGSTFKPTVGLGGLAEGLITRSFVWTCSGTYNFYAPSYTPGCAAGPGTHTIIEALKYSCNTYFFDVGRRMGIDNIVKYANQLGLGVPSGIEILEKEGGIASPSRREASGQVWHAGDVIQAAIGQSDTQVTPVQLAVYASTLANGGTRYKAHLVKEVVSYDGKLSINKMQPEILEKSTASKENFDIISDGMKAVTSPGGTAYASFATLPYKVAAKTGTPQSTDTNYNGTFICYGGPDEAHQIAIAIVGENIKGGYQLAPIARTIFDTYFPGGQIPTI